MLSVVVRLLLILCVRSGGWSSMTGLAAERPIEYRLLHHTKPRPGERVPGYGYVISVDEYLTEAQFKELVCRVIRDQEPKDYRHLAILFQYRLNSFSGIPTPEFSDSMIGRYRWSEGGSREYSLAVFVDKAGRDVPVRFHRFDHKADCAFDANAAPRR